jgi:hypothetical protein
MATRLTEKVVRETFENVFRCWGLKLWKDKPKDENMRVAYETYRLDYNPIYGGYQINKVLANSTGESWFYPSGGSRVSGRELIAYLNGYLDGRMGAI